MMKVDLNINDEPEIDRTPWFRQRETELITTIETIRRVAQSDDWIKLKSLIFEGLEESLDKRLKSEAEKLEVNLPETYRLQGQLIWAKKYADFDKLAEFFKNELIGVRNNLKNAKKHDE